MLIGPVAQATGPFDSLEKRQDSAPGKDRLVDRCASAGTAPRQRGHTQKFRSSGRKIRL